MKRLIHLYILFLILFFTTSCVSDFDFFDVPKDIQIDESLVLPVASISVTAQDIINRIGLPEFVDTTNSVISYVDTFKYSFKYTKLDISKIIRSYEKDFSLSPILIIPNNSDISVTENSEIQLSINENTTKEYVDSIIVNSAKMKIVVDVSPDLKGISPSDISVELEFLPDYLKFTNPTLLKFRPTAYNEAGFLEVGQFSVLLNKSTLIPFKIIINFTNQNSDVVVTSDSYVKLSIDFVDVNLSRYYGLFDVNLSDTCSYQPGLNIDSFIPNSLLRVSNPKLNMSVTSNIGMDLEMKVNQLKAYNSINPENMFDAFFRDTETGIKSKSFSDTFIGPQIYGGLVTKKFNEFNSDNSEFDKLFDRQPYPNVLFWDVAMTSIPTRTSNFISKDNLINLEFNLKVPLQFKENSYFAFSDTIENVNMEDIKDLVDSAVLVLKVKNSFPLSAKYRMTFWKSDLANDTVPAIGGSINTISEESDAGNLTSNYIISAPIVDDEGVVTEVVPQIIKIALNKSQIDALKQTKFIIFSLYLNSDSKDENGTTTSNPVSLTTKNNFVVNLGLFFKGNTVVNNN